MTLTHLYKVQKSKCHEFVVFVTYLAKKYPSLLKWASLWITHWSSLCESMSSNKFSSWRLKDGIISDLTVEDKDKTTFVQKFDRIVSTKQAYESAGGKFETK